MKLWKIYLPAILLILFELVVGILLFIDPVGFTSTVIVGFGVLLLAIAAVNFVRYFHARRTAGEGSALTLFLAILCLLIGCLCAFATGLVTGLFAVVAMVYGVILVVAGIYKLTAYLDRKQAGWHPSVLSLVAAVLSIALGLLVLFNPFEARDAVWTLAGASLIVEAVFDLIALFSGIFRGKPRLEE